MGTKANWQRKEAMGAIANDWLGPLSGEFKKPYYKKLYETVKHEYETRVVVFPDPNDILTRLNLHHCLR